MLNKLCCACLALVLLAGCVGGPRDAPALTRTEFMLDTFVSITLYGGGDEATLAEAFELARQLERVFCRHTPGSELYEYNAQGGIAYLLYVAAYYHGLSGGAFNVYIAGLMDLWFGAREFDAPRTPPGAEEIEWELQEGGGIDLGGIAKGFMADAIGRQLRENGVTSALIDLGGDILVVGGMPGGRAFRIGVRDPFERQLLGVVEVRDAAVATSGVYERYFMHEGRRYHHILDARTGWPAQSGVASVTVVSPSGLQADALSIVALLLGADAGLALIEATPGAEAIFVTESAEILLSSGLVGNFELA